MNPEDVDAIIEDVTKAAEADAEKIAAEEAAKGAAEDATKGPAGEAGKAAAKEAGNGPAGEAGKAAAGEGMILRDGIVTLEHEGKRMTAGPGFGEHEFQGHYSGEEINTEGYTIYCNAYTPFERKFTIRTVG